MESSAKAIKTVMNGQIGTSFGINFVMTGFMYKLFPMINTL